MNNITQPPRRKKKSRSKKDAGLIARNEYTIEKFSYFLFPHSKTKGLEDRRILIIERNDNEIKSLEVAPQVGKRAYTNRTYTTLLALLVLWHQNHSQDGWFHFHLSDVAKLKGIDPEAGKNLRNIRDDLYCLKTTTIDFKSAFIDYDGLENSLLNISILAELEWVSKAKCTRDRYVKSLFSPPITKNLLNGKTNLQNLQSILQISTEIGQILFRYIDTRIYKRKLYEKVSKELFKDIFGEDDRYKWASRRRQVLEHHLPLLDNKVLSTGKWLRVSLSETSDKTDIKIVCRTVPLDKRGSGKKKAIIADEIIESRTAAIHDAVGVNDNLGWQTWTRLLAERYSDILVCRVISEFKEHARHGNTKIQNREKYFTDRFHRLVHKTGVEWVGNCDESCSKRPENAPQ